MRNSSIIKKFGYSVMANVISLVASSLLVIIIPKFITSIDYGYWQLYLFYIGYVGLLQFGLCDGIYLRYGGDNYENLDGHLFSSQFRIYIIFQVFISLIFVLVVNLINVNFDKTIILYFTSLNIFIMNIKAYISYILQATARIKEYSLIVILDKVLYAAFVIAFVFCGKNSYFFIMIGDIIAKVITMFLSIYYCSDVLLKRCKITRQGVEEAVVNVKVGMSLMISNLMGSLVLGIVRFFIEHNWGIEEFGKVSFSLSLSNILVIFITAISTVIFPLIKRISQNESRNVYLILRDTLDFSILVILIMFFPLREIVISWIPAYEISVYYLIFLIPLCVYQARTALILTTYIKALRLEKKLVIINTVCGILSLIFSIITVKIFGSIVLACLSMSILFCIHSFLCEYAVSNRLDVFFFKNSIVFVTVLILFCLTTSLFTWYIGMGIYCIVVFVFIKFRKKELISLLKQLKGLFFKKVA